MGERLEFGVSAHGFGCRNDTSVFGDAEFLIEMGRKD